MTRHRTPKAYAVVLNWNNYEDSKKCLASLGRATYPDLKVIVVDNASADGSGERLQAEFPQYDFIFNEENLGFARGCNVGVRAALSDAECDYVLLLNNDAFVPPGFLEKAIDAAESNKLIGLVGGKILNWPEENRIWYAGGTIDRLRAGCRVRGAFEVDRGQYDNASEVGFVIGALMLIKREVLEKVGPLPEDYFFGVEDIDYSLRVRRFGYKLYYVPDFVAYHKGDGSHATFDPKFSYNGYRSRFIFQQKYLPQGIFPIWIKLFILYERYIVRTFFPMVLKKRGLNGGNALSFDDLDFALSEAVADHGKSRLSEETLARFDKLIKERKRQPHL